MVDIKKEAKKARKRVEGLDLSVDLDQLRDRLPDHVDLEALRSRLPDLPSNVDWNIIRQREDAAATRGFFGGLVLGAILGVVLALIFAPQRGEETRGLVKEKATDLVHQVRGETDQQRDDLAAQGPAIEREFGDGAESPYGATQSRTGEAQTRY